MPLFLLGFGVEVLFDFDGLVVGAAFEFEVEVLFDFDGLVVGVDALLDFEGLVVGIDALLDFDWLLVGAAFEFGVAVVPVDGRLEAAFLL